MILKNFAIIYFIMKIVQVVHTEERRRRRRKKNKQTNKQTKYGKLRRNSIAVVGRFSVTVFSDLYVASSTKT